MLHECGIAEHYFLLVLKIVVDEIAFLFSVSVYRSMNKIFVISNSDNASVKTGYGFNKPSSHKILRSACDCYAFDL